MKFTAGPASFYETIAQDVTSMLIGGVTNLAGGILGAGAAKDAASTQATAGRAAAAETRAMYDTTRNDLAPFRQYGTTAGDSLTSQLPYLTSGFNPTQAQLEATPGYKFNLSQGLNAVQNSAAAKGLGISGAALKGATDYATGLADSTLKTQFDIDQANKTNSFNKMLGLAGLGENAAAQTGQLGTTAAQNAGQFGVGAANSEAAGDIGAANAWQKGLGGASSAYQTYSLAQNPALVKALYGGNRLSNGSN